MASLAQILPFRHVFVGLAIGIGATALLAAACLAIPFVIVRARLRRPLAA